MYDESYDNPGIRSASYDAAEALAIAFPSHLGMALDLGCGSCRKTVRLAKRTKQYFGLDANAALLSRAQERLRSEGVHNVHLVLGDSARTPFRDGRFDLVSSFLSRYWADEVERLLVPGGVFVVETLGHSDKAEVKRAFGYDRSGPRGYLADQDSPELRFLQIEQSLGPRLSIEYLQEVRFVTSLTVANFVLLLELTPTIRGFNRIADAPVVAALASPDGLVEFEEHRIVLVARKR